MTPVFGPGSLDPRLCLAGGQVFGWTERAPGVWEGTDGPARYRLRASQAGLAVEEGTPEAFRRFAGQAVAEVAGELLRLSPGLEGPLARVEGLRLMQPANASQVLLCFLCSANNHLARIDQMVAHLASLGGSGFPSLRDVAEAGEGWLAERGFGYRARQVASTAAQAHAQGGEEWLAGLRFVGYEAAVRELRQLPGVGPKVADCVALYGLHYGEAVPVDTHLWQAAAPVFLAGAFEAGFSQARARELANRIRGRFGALAGWAQLVLFADRLTREGSRRGWRRVTSAV